jgi:Spy/CpxP family protein refolding chaperone
MRQQMSRVVPLAVALLGASAAQAQPPQGLGGPGLGLHGPGPQGPGLHGMGRQGPGFDERRAHGPHAALTRMLGLSEEQQETLRGILDEQRPQLEALHEKLSANRDALHQMLEGGSADAAAVGELVLEGRRLHEEGRTLRESQHKAIRGLLTPEQQKKFDAVKERHRGAGPRGQGPGGPGVPGMQKPRQPRPGQAPAQP